MTEQTTGQDKPRIKGDWAPPYLITPHFQIDLAKPKAVLKYFFGFPGYLWPQPILFFAFSCLTWAFLTPDRAARQTLSWDWIWPILLRNTLLVAVFMSLAYYLLYVRRTQDTLYKYNKRWPDASNPSFFGGSQLVDNVFYSFVWATPIMTAWEVLGLWTLANGYTPTATWAASPVYLTMLILTVQVYHIVHFHAAHWLLHRGPMYTYVHAVHHRNVNIAPWSGMSLHPVEAFMFFSPVWLYLVIPSNELIVITYIQYAFFTTIPSHLGFGRLVTGADGASIDSDHYHHYLHHRYHECNYSGSIIDRVLGTFHDGTVEAHERMKARIKKRNVQR
jgi:sterol desaturase/sphingolipid hydroxylase (fatty acid hydroxylase superfamily)